ncbi:MAG: tetratricopeptide repeat protein, partial [Burkholderiaceae bacterium]|nr:tetratricopeptide repeat protein [Burkholderiaceae bacterium]
INGIGTMLYGRGDERDGTWVATRFFVFVFVPLWPIDAWRVRSEGDRAWRFFGRERIGPKSRAMRWAVLGLLGCALFFGALGSWRNSPRHLAAHAIAEARALEEAGNADEALRAYRSAFDLWAREPRGDLVKPAASGIVRILASRIGTPASAEDEVHVVRLLTTWRRLTPSHARGAEAAGLVNDAVGTWCLALSPDRPGDASAMVHVAGSAIEAGLTDPRHAQCLSRARIAEAEAWAQGWPGDAIDAFAAIDDDAAHLRAVEMLDAIAGNAELLAQHADAVQATLPHASTALAERVAATRAADRARVADPARSAALAARGDELAAWVAEHPTDQYAVLAHAEGLLAAGRIEDAVLAVHNVGAPGATVRSLLHLRVMAQSQAGDSRSALDIVRHLRRVRLPRYLEVSMAYDERGNALIEDIDRRASNGTLPADVMDRLLALEGDAQGAAYNQYVMERLQTDAELSALREQLDELSDGFMAAMQQGSLALELANASTGDAREALLAEAEDAYLAIRTEGAGMPEWHLGLARVYFRLGRTEQAEEQLAQVSSSLDPTVLGQVSETLRELGLTLRARETSQRALDLARDDDTR